MPPVSLLSSLPIQLPCKAVREARRGGMNSSSPRCQHFFPLRIGWPMDTPAVKHICGFPVLCNPGNIAPFALCTHCSMTVPFHRLTYQPHSRFLGRVDFSGQFLTSEFVAFSLCCCFFYPRQYSNSSLESRKKMNWIEHLENPIILACGKS